jgi:hypothetical protein
MPAFLLKRQMSDKEGFSEMYGEIVQMKFDAAPGYLLMPIYDGDIQEAVVLHALRT